MIYQCLLYLLFPSLYVVYVMYLIFKLFSQDDVKQSGVKAQAGTKRKQEEESDSDSDSESEAEKAPQTKKTKKS